MRVVSNSFIGNNKGWSVVGAADFNGDGKADILWNDSTGKETIWFMDGNTLTRTAVIGQ